MGSQIRSYIFGCILLLTIGTVLSAQEKPNAPGTPPHPIKGTLVIVGGGKIPDSVIDAFRKAAGDKPNLVVVPTASVSADKEQPQKTIDLWQNRGFKNVAVLHTRSRDKANSPDFAKPLTQANAVWFGGGAQTKITDAYRGTLVETELHKLLERGGTIAGTSAGAAVMSKLMIAGGKIPATLDTGFGFLPNAVVDQHFLKRNRVDRLLDTLHRQPGWFGIGIDEGTAAVVQAQSITVVGNSMVMLCQRSTPERPASCRVLHAGEKADLIDASRNALERGKVSK